jgi:hypothetical protein
MLNLMALIWRAILPPQPVLASSNAIGCLRGSLVVTHRVFYLDVEEGPQTVRCDGYQNNEQAKGMVER